MDTHVQAAALIQHVAQGSVDGLVCMLDVRQREDEAALSAVLSVGVSVARVGPAGPAAVWCATDVHGLQVATRLLERCSSMLARILTAHS